MFVSFSPFDIVIKVIELNKRLARSRLVTALVFSSHNAIHQPGQHQLHIHTSGECRLGNVMMMMMVEQLSE